jgi:hypothetical protein
MTDHTLKSDIKHNVCLTKLEYETETYYRDSNNSVYDSKFNKIGYYKPSIETIVTLVVSGEDSEK